MIKIAVVGLGKMGISHLSMLKAHPQVELAAVCDTMGYVLDVLRKYTGVTTYSDFDKMLAEVQLSGIILATPSAHHVEMVRKALGNGLAVFCEKPLTLDPAQSDELVRLAEERRIVNQVGYHNRFVGAFRELKRLLDAGAIGQVSHGLAEAYGPVVLKPKGSTWRTQRQLGGGSLYDYAAHPINLLTWYLGRPYAVGGTVLNRIFSADTDDEVYSTLYFSEGKTAQLSVNWSDESQRKMATKVTFWGTGGRIYADRQELQIYLRDEPANLPGYRKGWNVRYTTELTEPVWFYLRGEEYSAQLDYFVEAIRLRRTENVNSFASAAETDHVISMLLADPGVTRSVVPVNQQKEIRSRMFSLFGR